MTCPRCGHENNEGDRFCANCGARLTPIAPPKSTTEETQTSPSEASASAGEPAVPEPERPRPSRIPPPVTPSFAGTLQGGESSDDEWKMSSLGPPPKPRRRLWLWIIVAIFAVIVIACCSFMFFISATDTGQEWFSDFATQVVEEATQQAE